MICISRMGRIIKDLSANVVVVDIACILSGFVPNLWDGLRRAREKHVDGGGRGGYGGGKGRGKGRGGGGRKAVRQ